MKITTLDLASFSADKPRQTINLLFIHHSTGGQLLADKGVESGNNCIYTTHPNGGGLRRLLEVNNYAVHEASYGSLIGDKTDICHWNAKFKNYMENILICNKQDVLYQDNTKNQIVVFKSCFPNSYIEGEGSTPGNPDSCSKTVANYKATYQALQAYFKKQPDTLFVVITAPPLVQPTPNIIKDSLKSLLKREDTVVQVGRRARYFNSWLKDVQNGWLKDYPVKNIVVFGYYDILTGEGKSNWSLYPSDGGKDSHPNSEGNTKAAHAFIPFINQAVHRMGF